MNYFLFISTVFLFSLTPESESICISRRTEWGEFGAFFTDPLCDVWCRIRACGKGVCKEDPSIRRANNARCVCEKCYRDDDGTVIYPDDDGMQWTRTNSDSRSTSQNQNLNRNGNQNQNPRTQDDLYPSQDSYDNQMTRDRYNSN